METEKVIAFKHPKPYWENHVLIVPKKAIRDISSIQQCDFDYITAVFQVAKDIVADNNWDESDYTIITNGGSRQEVEQLHFHLGSGRVL